MNIREMTLGGLILDDVPVRIRSFYEPATTIHTRKGSLELRCFNFLGDPHRIDGLAEFVWDEPEQVSLSYVQLRDPGNKYRTPLKFPRSGIRPRDLRFLNRLFFIVGEDYSVWVNAAPGDEVFSAIQVWLDLLEENGIT